MPFHEFLGALRALRRLRAVEAMTTARAIALALLSDEQGGDRLRRDIEREADPRGA